MRPKVVIVGGGISGLTSAVELLGGFTADPPSGGLRPLVTVLEASDRTGGRTLSAAVASSPDTTIDLGGQWVGAHQTALHRVLRCLGLTLVPQHHEGKRILELNGAVHTVGLRATTQ